MGINPAGSAENTPPGPSAQGKTMDGKGSGIYDDWPMAAREKLSK